MLSPLLLAVAFSAQADTVSLVIFRDRTPLARGDSLVLQGDAPCMAPGVDRAGEVRVLSVDSVVIEYATGTLRVFPGQQIVRSVRLWRHPDNARPRRWPHGAFVVGSVIVGAASGFVISGTTVALGLGSAEIVGLPVAQLPADATFATGAMLFAFAGGWYGLFTGLRATDDGAERWRELDARLELARGRKGAACEWRPRASPDA